ncbi:CDP-alcohol phosphatidyltransferase family protein [Phytomonospora sp. NPDC050363]|uniref:CDP-alcohol phosphatidyltransferase family protein n=1 Tax=Phytomonospora sp. NPDC050363 TaxID=3155642 RepID=UPI0033E3EEE9
MPSDPVLKPRAADFLAVNRRGGLFTQIVNQRIGAYCALAAHRLGLAPTMVTLINLVLGLAVSALLVATAPAMADGRVSPVLMGLLALVVWQFAYSLDCADGQLARVTGRSSPAGAKVDILADIAQQTAVTAATASVAVAYVPETPTWLVAAFAGLWMTNLVTSVMGKGGDGDSLIASESVIVGVVKLIRDYGAIVVFIPVVIAFAPQWTIWVLALFAFVNGGFLAALIAKTALDSLKPPQTQEG